MKYTIPAEVIHNGGIPFEVTAYKTEALGLITHHNIFGTSEYPQIGGAWMVTHVKSGVSVAPGSFDLRKDAKEYAKRVAHLVDWEQDKDTIALTDGLQDALKHIYREVVYPGKL